MISTGSQIVSTRSYKAGNRSTRWD